MKNKKIFYIYPGKKGGGLESTLTMYEIGKELGLEAFLLLSKDNERKPLIEKLYPEAQFYDFWSLNDLLKMKKEISDNWSFFTMISPKMFPLYYLVGKNRLFYYHGTFENVFSDTNSTKKILDIMQVIAIKEAFLTLVPQYHLLWQIKAKLAIETVVLRHPPYILRKGFFEEEEKDFSLPFKEYFLYFGDVSRIGKGINVLLKAMENSRKVNLVIAGRSDYVYSSRNILHINKWVEDSLLHTLIKNCKAVILPYLITSQFSGCAALAFHFRKPILASRIPAFEEWVDEGKTGWFFSVGDYNDLSEKMNIVWEDSNINPKDIENKEKYLWHKSKEDFKKIVSNL